MAAPPRTHPGHHVGALERQVEDRPQEHAVLKALLRGIKLLACCNGEVLPAALWFPALLRSRNHVLGRCGTGRREAVAVHALLPAFGYCLRARCTQGEVHAVHSWLWEHHAWMDGWMH